MRPSRALLFAWLAAGLLTLAPGPAHAGAIPEIVDVTLSPGTATVGDRLTLRIVIRHDPATVIEGPRFDAGYGDFELVDIAPPRVEAGTTQLDYTLTTFGVGLRTLPPLAVAFRGPAGEGTLATPSLSVRVDSVLSPDDTSLRPLKPQLDIDPVAPAPALPVAVVVAFAVLTLAGYALFVRAADARPLAPAPAAPVPPPPPHDVARATLDALASGVPPPDLTAFYASVSTALRRYLSDVFAFPAYAMTRTELTREMSHAGIDRWPARLAANLLEQCDAVQFAGFRPAPERVEADLTAAYEIIELTAPPHAPSDYPAPDVALGSRRDQE